MWRRNPTRRDAMVLDAKRKAIPRALRALRAPLGAGGEAQQGTARAVPQT